MSRGNTRRGLMVLSLFAFFLSALSPSLEAKEIDEITKAIKDKRARWEAQETEISKMDSNERQKRLGAIMPASTGQEKTLPTPALLVPAKLDWRDYLGNSYVTAVKDQGACGSCWAFAPAAALESVTLISQNTPGIPLDLSEQVVTSCSGAGTCYGGLVDSASDFLRDIGIPAESCFPYIFSEGNCAQACFNWQADTYKIADWYRVPPTVDALKYALYNFGPLVATMDVYTDFYYYHSGVYSHTWGSYEGYHAATIVGYDDAEQAFIVKSSWGTGWGEAGFFRIAYSEIESVVAFGFWTIAYEKAIPADLPILDGIPRDPNAASVLSGSKDPNKGKGKKDDPLAISSLEGLVSDDKGAPIGGVDIKVGKYSAVSGTGGGYSISGIPSGSYVITASKGGYTTVSENISIAPSATVTKNFTLTASSSNDPGNPNAKDKGQIAGPGWVRFKADPISPSEAKTYHDKKEIEHAGRRQVGAVARLAAASIPTEILELARALRYDPKLIYDYVHNNIDHVPNFGLHKGPLLTYLDGNGNDFDQASLMIALLRASGYTAQYVYGTMQIPSSDLYNWLGYNAPSNGGIPSDSSSISRVWVKANIGGTDYLFDPAFKTYTGV